MTTDAQRQQYVQQIASASVPDVVDTSYQAQLASLGDYAQTAFNEVLAQYRFMGLVCGIKSESAGDTDQDVQDARDAIMEAISDFLNTEQGPIGTQVDQFYREYLDMRDATDLHDRFSENEVFIINDALGSIGGIGHPRDTGSYAQDILDGVRRPNLSRAFEAGRISQSGLDYINAAADKYEEAVRLELMRREIAAERRRQWWNGVWDGVRTYYDENMELIRNGQWLLATGRIAIDAMIFAAEEIVITGLIAGIVVVTGGLAAGIMLALRAALRAALSVVRMGTRTVRRVNATWDFKIELRKVEPGVLYSNPIPVNVTIGRKLDFEHRVNVENDLTPDERRAMGEGGEGSTRPDADAAENGNGGDGPNSVDDPTYRHPRDGDPPRDRQDLLVNGRVPGRNQFRNWFNDLSPDELDDLWNFRDPASNELIYRTAIRQRLLNGGGHHEWLMRSRAPHLKRLGFDSDDIMDFVDATDDLSGPIPDRPGERWRHNPEDGGRGPGPDGPTMHGSLGRLIDSSTSRNELLRNLGRWSEGWLDHGIDSFPANLQQAIRDAGG